MENKSQKPIKRVLILADFGCVTGFASVSQNIVRQLLLDEKIQYQIDIVGINFTANIRVSFNSSKGHLFAGESERIADEIFKKVLNGITQTKEDISITEIE